MGKQNGGAGRAAAGGGATYDAAVANNGRDIIRDTSFDRLYFGSNAMPTRGRMNRTLNALAARTGGISYAYGSRDMLTVEVRKRMSDGEVERVRKQLKADTATVNGRSATGTSVRFWWD